MGAASGMSLGGLNTRACMESFEMMLFTACLTLFTAWLSYLTHRLRSTLDELNDASRSTDEIAEAIEISQKALAVIYENMPTMERIQELVPQFHINQQESNGKHLFDFINNLIGNPSESLQASQPPRDAEGRYYGAAQIQEEVNPSESQTDVESPTSD